MMLNRASCQESPPGHWLYIQGQTAHRFFLLESGLVSLTELTPSGEETLVRFVVPGEVFGYLALSSRDSNVLSAQTLHKSRVICWDRASALQLMQVLPKAAMNLFSIFASDIAHFYHRTRRFRAEPLERRVQWALAELTRAVGKPTPHGIMIEHTGQQQLAALAGTTVYSVSRELSKLERRGMLSKDRKRIILLRPES